MSAGIHTRARGADVSFRDVTIKIPDRNMTRGMWMTSCTWSVRGGFWGIRKKSVSWVPGLEEEGWLSQACRGVGSGAHVVWGRWKSQVYLSPYVEKPLNSKVIKSFVPELRSRQVFFVFRDSDVLYICYIYAWWTFYVHFTYSYMAM